MKRLTVLSVVCIVLVSSSVRMLGADEVDVPISASEFSRRVTESKQLLAHYRRLSAAGHIEFERISQSASMLNRVPSYAEFMEIMRQSPNIITTEDFSALYWIFSRLQKSSITPEKLSAIYKARDEEIKSIKINYDVNSIQRSHGEWKSTNSLLADATKLLWERTILVAPKGQKRERHLLAFDGKTYRDAVSVGEAIEGWEHGQSVVARIQPLDTRFRFYDRWNPLILQGVFDDVRRLQSTSESLSMFIAHGTVFEMLENVNGVPCVVVGNEYRTCYLSEKYGYALVAVRSGHFLFDDKIGKVIRGESYSEQNADEFAEVENGIWMPKRIRTLNENGADSESATIEIKSCEINQPLDADEFVDVIPVGALVTEPSRPRAYRWTRKQNE